MNDYKKRILIDIGVIICGVLGFITSVVFSILGLNGVVDFDLTFVLTIPSSVFFIVYGMVLMNRDKKKYGKK